MAWRRKTRKARPRRVKQHSDGTVCYHHYNRLDPCSKQSPFLFELPLVFGFPSSRILGCDQYFCLNWEQRCFLWVVVWQEYVQHYAEIALHSARLYLHCCYLLWGVAQGEEKCTVPEAKQNWSRSLSDRCPGFIDEPLVLWKAGANILSGTAAFLFLS